MLLPLSLLMLLGCRQSADAPPATPTHHIVLVQEEQTTVPAEPKAPDTAAPAQAALITDTADLGPEPGKPLKLLPEDAHHKYEVWEGAEKKEWLGLFPCKIV